VRYFGRELDVVVPMNVEILRKSCFQASKEVERVIFDNDSKLRIICRSALYNCSSLRCISIPASVEIIDESVFKSCTGLESCLIDENANLRIIEKEAFGECRTLGSFYIPRSIEIIGENCFHKCVSLHRLMFASSESFNKLIGNSTLDEALEKFGLADISGIMRIEMAREEYLFNFEDGHLVLIKVPI
jgi:hypothetical protein